MRRNERAKRSAGKAWRAVASLAVALIFASAELPGAGTPDWTSPWRWDAGKLTASMAGDDRIEVAFAQQGKGAFVERVIPPEIVAKSGGVIEVSLDMQVLEVDGAEQKIQVQIKPPGETAYRDEDPGYAQVRSMTGKPTAVATLRVGEESKWDSQNVPALQPGGNLKMVFRMDLKTGSTKIDVSSDGKEFELSRQVSPQLETCLSKGLVLRIKPQSEDQSLLKLSIAAGLGAPAASPAE